MIATAIHPGRMYRVRGRGFDISVIAKNGAAAICAVIDAIIGEEALVARHG